MREFQISFAETKYVSREEHITLSKRCAPYPGDILLTKVGTIGLAAVVPKESPDFDLFVSVCLIKPKSEKILSAFLCAVLNTPIARTQFARVLKGVGVPDLHLENIRDTLIPVPPLDIQQNIVAELDAARAARKQKLDEADALLAGVNSFVLQQLGLTVPQEEKRLAFAIRLGQCKGGRTDALYNAPHFSKVLRALKNCPHKKVLLGTLSPEIAGGATPTRGDADLYADEGIKFLRILNVAPFEVVLNNLKYIQESVNDGELARSKLAANDVLMTITGRVGTAAVVLEETLPANINQHIVRLRIQGNDCLPEYLAAWLNSSIGNALSNRGVTGGTRIALDYETIRNLLIPLPPLSIQQTIAAEVTRRRNQARCLRDAANTGWQAAKARFEQQLLGEPVDLFENEIDAAVDQFEIVAGAEWSDVDLNKLFTPESLPEASVAASSTSKKRRRTLDSMPIYFGSHGVPGALAALAIVGPAPAALLPTLSAPSIDSAGSPLGAIAIPSSAGDDLQADLLKDPRNVPVWFGTNRAPVNPQDLSQGFSGEWSEATTLGRCIVNVPKGHVPGETGSAWWIRLVKGDDRLHVVSIEPLPNFWNQINEAMKKPREEGAASEALFFLHGYNVTFEQAAIRTAQLAYDLRIQPAAFFSWPSRGNIEDYEPDEATIEASFDAVSDFIKRLDNCALDAGATLHVVAHSMGNRALLKALEAVAQGMAGGSKSAIDKLVFAAPDVDARVFMQSLGKIVPVGKRKTLYTSHRDKAVWLSKSIHKYARVGLIPPVAIARGLDTIDATDVDKTFIGHNYVATVRALINDLSLLFKAGLPPKERGGVEPAETPDGHKYWQIL